MHHMMMLAPIGLRFRNETHHRIEVEEDAGVVDVGVGVMNSEEEAGTEWTLEGVVGTMAEISHHLVGIGSRAEIRTQSHRITETTKALAGIIAGPKTKPCIIIILHRPTITEINNVSVNNFPVFHRMAH
jgi:hypothetical protein